MNFKELIEKRNALVDQAQKLFETADAEKRALTADEMASYEAISKEIKDIDKTLNLAKEARSFEMGKAKEKQEHRSAQEQYEMECRAFEAYVRKGESALQTRDDSNWVVGENGAVIPTTIANKIIETVENICPIYNMATKYRVKGKLVFPVYDETTKKIEAAYADEFDELESTAGKFTKVELGGYLVGVLSKISRSLINNDQFALVPYVITKIAQAITRFLENELLLGTTAAGKMQGVVATAKQKVTAKGATAITGDDLIDLQLAVPEVYQANACWIVNRNTLGALRKLKDGNGRYMLQDDLTKGFGFTLLGKHVYVSDKMPDVATKAKPIVYGDMSGLYVNIHEDINLQMLMEKYATEHVVGAVAWLEMDSKLVEPQKVAVLEMA